MSEFGEYEMVSFDISICLTFGFCHQKQNQLVSRSYMLYFWKTAHWMFHILKKLSSCLKLTLSQGNLYENTNSKLQILYSVH